MKIVKMRYDGHIMYVRAKHAVGFMLIGWNLCR